MKLLVTGLNGTLAPILAREAASRGLSVIGWDRGAIPPEDAAASQAWLEAQRPDCIAHLATGSVDWARQLALHACRNSVPLVFTSTAMVFHRLPDGPHHSGDPRNSQEPYGQYKRECEDAILAAHPGACVARIGWQIDPERRGNNMLFALDQWQEREGRVSASRAWRPACSFMEDTALALLHLLQSQAAGVRHIDSNADEGHGFAAIAGALRQVFNRTAWRIVENEDYVHDQRLAGGGALVPPLSARLAPLERTPSGN
jgi:dTDP-4-dehydrorhamnose reductase